MVEHNTILNSVFSSLADPTRRDILLRVSRHELSIGELAKPYHMSFAAVSKHVMVLESASLVSKHQVGKQQFVQVVPSTLQIAKTHLGKYEKVWKARFSALDAILKSTK